MTPISRPFLSKLKLKQIESLGNFFCFECLGVKIGVRSNDLDFIKQFKKLLSSVLPIKWREINRDKVSIWFSVIKKNRGDGQFNILKDFELLNTKNSSPDALNFLESQIRINIAEFAEDFVFLHAGAVSYKGKAIVIPGKSFSGKTTLVKELIKRDCTYLSDEYAIIDRAGLIHPFPKKLSLRGIINDFEQVDFSVEELGGEVQSEPVCAGYLLLTEFEKENKNSTFELKSVGGGIMATIANSVSVRQNPQFVLEVLSNFANQSTIIKVNRGEADGFADKFLNYLNKFEVLNTGFSVKK